MKTLLLTAYDDAMAPIGALTAPLMLRYANMHGMEFHCSRIFEGASEPYWQKVWDILALVSPSNPMRKHYDRVIWLDADQVITNPSWVPPWGCNFHASLDWGFDAVDDDHFSACGFVLHSDTFGIISDVANAYEDFAFTPFPEQRAMRDMRMKVDYWRRRMITHPRRVFNAVPKEIAPEAPEPWQHGDFCAHLTHIPVEERVAIFHQIRQQAPW